MEDKRFDTLGGYWALISRVALRCEAAAPESRQAFSRR